MQDVHVGCLWLDMDTSAMLRNGPARGRVGSGSKEPKAVQGSLGSALRCKLGLSVSHSGCSGPNTAQGHSGDRRPNNPAVGLWLWAWAEHATHVAGL